MFKKSLLAASMMGAIIGGKAFAFEFVQPVQTPVIVTKSQPGLAAGKSTKQVTIMRVTLSDTEKQALAHRASFKGTSLTTSTLPASIQLGMNGVPVLDQGRHGSCVTFATSAAVDAVLGKGDYMSQLCNLELGTHLEKYGYTFSGWDGSYGPTVLNQITTFGIVSKATEKEKSCANVSEYPLNDESNKGNELSLTEFKSISENLTNKMYWLHLYSNDQLFDWKTAKKDEMTNVLINVKTALAKGNRVTFGVFLILNGTCHAGACAKHNAEGDTWALTDDYDTPPYEVGGHEMVITGYDDNAIAYEDSGKAHKGLLTLRNSWGADVGDQGNYYMSYDYFVKYANEAQVIVGMSK